MIVKHENFKNNIEVSSVVVVDQTDENLNIVQVLNGVVNIVITDPNGEEFGIALSGYVSGSIQDFVNSELNKLKI